MVEREDGELAEQEDLVHREPWRSTALEIRAEYVAWAQEQHTQRQAHGLAKYGPVTFHGNPLDQGIAENLDQLFYLYWAQKQLSFVEGQRNTYRHLLEAVMEFGLSQMVFEKIQEALDVPSSPTDI